MSSGGALPPTSFNPFPYLFPTQPHFFTPNQRIKMKRQRQRVDAGEPRNSYQQPRVPPKQDNGSSIQQNTAIPLNVNQLFPNLPPWMQIVNDLPDEKVEPEEGMHPIEESQENENEEMEDAPVSNASATESTSSSISSSSRRKNNAPRKNSPSLEGEKKEEMEDEDEIEKEEEETQLTNMSDIIDAHSNLYSSIMKHHKESKESENSEMSRLAEVLKKEIMSSISSSIDKIIGDWLMTERKEKNGVLSSLPSLIPHSSSIQSMNPYGMSSGSIFPPSFNPFLGAINGIRKEEETRKRKLEMPSVRSKMTISPSIRDNTPLSDRAISPIICGSTPLPSYFPSSMLGHSLYDMLESPFDSDDDDGIPYDPSMPQSSTLTPMHLRKAKLMFFFTRYPNSSVLKQYFPDIRFNKNNTAQLVKWFSNFREFYYNQMDKYAKQTVAEGIQKREDIIVTRDSEIFKQLNQHYNRNNHIEAPDRLVWVVQESLREFYDAIKLGRHNEPSWKKQIYKIICRLDDTIPDYFKDAHFLDKLE